MVVAALERKREEEENKRLAQDLITEVVRVNYGDIEEIAENLNLLLEKKVQGGQNRGGGGGGGTNTRRGSITVDTRTNTLIISDIPEHVYEMLQLIRILDIQTPQVMIEARIVEISKKFSEKLGVSWGFTGGLGNDFALTGATVVRDDLITNSNFIVDLVPAGADLAAGGVGFILDGLGKAGSLRMQLDALERESKARILSSPKVTTLDNRKAVIKEGSEIPFATTSADGTEVQFIEAELSLEVTPHITSDNYILMEIKATRNSPDTTLAVPGFTAAGLTTKEVETEVLVKNGDTTVLGGIYSSSTFEAVDAVPFFSKIPFLGYLFKKTDIDDQVTELLVFVSPTIITQVQ
jgi:type IV pilus assembly protein PilQ